MSTVSAPGPRLDLSPREQQLQALLVDAAAHLDRSRPGEQPTILRWAGGWVRDKLLGIESHDIDTAINTMTGYAFSVSLREFCANPVVIREHAIGAKDLGHLHKIAANPDKSKHLETATSTIFGLDVDFVNLRKETYADDSRNPQMQFGTAQEDALRRDATVNALFYNLHTDQVEDLVGGLADMEAKVLRTPMEPLQTFMDDPLRVLRLVRFSSRLGFAIHDEARRVMSDQRVLNALALKISRERVEVEVSKMLQGNDPRSALQLIDNLGLYHAIFTNPTVPSFPRPDLGNWEAVYNYLDEISKTRAPGSIYSYLVQTDEAAYYAWVLAALVPWSGVTDVRPQGQKGKPLAPFQALVVQEGLKGTTRLRDLAAASHRNREEIFSMMRSVADAGIEETGRDKLGMAIRRWDQHGGYWRLQVLYALLVDASSRLMPLSSQEEIDAFSSGWQMFLDRLSEADLLAVTTLKRLVDGNTLAKALGVRPGKWMMEALDICLAWQLRNPLIDDPAAAIDEVRQRRQELGIP